MDKSDKKAPPAAAPAPAADTPHPPKAGWLTKTPILLGGVMVMEAAVLLGGFKLFGSEPQQASAVEISLDADGHPKTNDKDKVVEVPVVEFKALNRSNGRTFLYDVSIYSVVKAAAEERVKAAFGSKKALIEDRVRTIIADSDPEKLGGGAEPGLETLRRQVKFQLDTMLGEGVIEEVLVPRCIPFRTDY